MTFQIKASNIGDAAAQDAFIQRVEAFRQAKLAHHQTVNEPAPTEHDLIEACVRRVPRGEEPYDYVADYEIVQPTLDERKQEQAATVHAAEAAALYAKLSLAKRRLLSYQLADVGKKSPFDQTDADKAALDQHRDLAEHAEKVGRHAAQLLADIEDLTEETIKTWRPAPFPK